MNFELIRNVVAAFYSDHEMIVIEAFLGHYADGDESIAVDEDKLNEIVNIKARTLRAALGKLQKGQLLYTQMTQRDTSCMYTYTYIYIYIYIYIYVYFLSDLLCPLCTLQIYIYI